MRRLFDGEPRDQAEQMGALGDEGPDPDVPLAGGEPWGGLGAEDTGLVRGPKGASRGLAGAVGQVVA